MKPVETRVRSLNICVDLRMELLSVIQWLSDYGTRFPILTPHDSQYKDALVKHFSSFRNHEAVRLLNEIFSRPMGLEDPPFAFGAPPEVMLYLLPDFNLDQTIFSNEFLVKRAGGKEMLLRWIAAVQNFFEDSHFEIFFEECRPICEQIVSNNAAEVGKKDYISELEAFYGMKQGSYTFILAPLYDGVGFGPSITIDGVRHVYEILGASGVENGIPLFNYRFEYMQRHEFSHSFVNPLAEKYWLGMQQHFTAYASPAEAQEIVNESTIRAITTWLAYQESKESGDLHLYYEQAQGFLLVVPLLEKVRHYTTNRAAYPTFESFYSEIIGVFEGHRKQGYSSVGKAIIGATENQ